MDDREGMVGRTGRGGECTLFSFMAGLSAPRMSFCEAEVNSARPAMGRYSWLRLGSERSRSSAWKEQSVL